ncbi:MAG TPA: DUF6705 family protein [Flavobacterium sp.]|uniref:DUF6705 family protein n=1 Tax=Flavobacterium sp. TaxID=239 RepID=UPI002BDE8505|nr:DUF6705 family protein [Flavobacterium sp.]HSD14507.1 DUF6705 family protein [Flavobacterium sp.]
MKKLIFLLAVSVLVSTNVIGQTLSIEQLGMTPKNGAYYKDNENLLNNFVGTWLYTTGNTSLKFVLKKVTRYNYNPNYSEDLLVGEYEYIKNGVVEINTLNNINSTYIFSHSIHGNTVLYYDEKPPCNDCTVNEKRLRIIFEDPIKETAGDLFLRRVTVAGQQAISVQFLGDGFKYTGGPNVDNIVRTYVEETVPNGVYVLIKQP